MLAPRNFGTWLSFCWLSLGSVAMGGEPAIEYVPLSPDLVAVPQNLLNLVHADEVQTELRFSAEQLSSWERMLREVDARWWPGRILPSDRQRRLIAELELKVVDALQHLLGTEAVHRLRQIELQSQVSRILVRPEVAKFLQLDSRQSQKLTELFAEHDQLAADLASKNAKNDPEIQQKYIAAKQAEPKKALAILTPAQSERLRRVVGNPFETANLERIYPLAPELVDSGHWTSHDQPTLESLKGQVVLVHFYAFQCHNCVANFGHYKRWDETWKAKGVRVIGIQTPETAAERDPEKVRSASTKDGFRFPVLIDLERKNWAAWGNTVWPTVYVIDKKGYIRFWWQGELNWQGATTDKKIESVVERLLGET